MVGLILGAEYDLEFDAATWQAIKIGVVGGLLTVAVMVIVGRIQKRRNRPTG
ncbi:MAG TPA: hypothetical protein VGF55_31495 [Gemmataceae bacterium]|jgi:hypothetical protein